MMRHQLTIISFIIILLLNFMSCNKDNSETIKIALVCPMTGDVAAMGHGMERATEIAIEYASNSQKFKGKHIQLAVFDDRADPKEAVNVANQIISDKRIFGVVGHLNSGCSIPASHVYARRNITMISPASTNPKLTLQELKNVFRVCTTDDVQGSFAADYIVDRLGLRKVAVIHDKTAYGQGIAEEFKKRFEQRKGKVVSFDGVDLGDKDFKALLTRIKTGKPSLIYFGGMYTECGLLSKQAKELGLNVPVFSDDGVYTREYIKIGGKATEGNYVSMVGIPADKLPKAKEFIKKYKSRYSDDDMQPYDPYTYEAASILLEAVSHSGFNREKVANHIAQINYEGILGTTKFDSKGDTLNKTISIYRVKNGNFVYCQEF